MEVFRGSIGTSDQCADGSRADYIKNIFPKWEDKTELHRGVIDSFENHDATSESLGESFNAEWWCGHNLEETPTPSSRCEAGDG